ncbi:flagellar M-ring protein FliF [Acidithiobacillus sp. CV18-2]|uniref:Flagellar M-ring protein n=1 Tax=Igneacidithiobacillus copahuensis TaxID=2724909 RepID=A0AAE2YNJ7_9PROT|nr:flagellar basal-body MS-ring/collar protein FliF [Igneacidithiobacillus copahuensis]MBU2754388.1 flagellar M-ring protein FliF [Acidithiobacillus sp. CV18-3]MBU2757589.1 flagellar M-ring protein FliF [Acidithiobacillus sp. BN09-2]MBU2777096.1 flagellar M-ring protein FliF [Acidithiobacillus sp. CV18-2]MBU2797409.1 flagellar M-ring protein FliF [Acidithiobacillus sp. VAN18-2]MBU2799753.1 flagellar M-ring protein FliF [Acidithiobacillus sp. VAN18-4]
MAEQTLNPSAARLDPRQWQQRWLEMPANRRFAFLVLLAAVVAVLLVAALWHGSGSYQVLYAGLSDRDGGQVIAQLQKLNVPFRITDGGTVITVPSNVVYSTRMKLAAEGLPHGDAVGFELLDHEPMGTSDFVEHVNYQRALEGSLERTISSLGEVEHARVQLAIPKPSVFLDQEQKPTASVMLTVYPGRQLSAGQVAGIVHLVAASVPGLEDKNVTVVDQHGNLLSSNANQSLGLQPAQFAYQQAVDAQYQKRIEAIISPIVGSSGVHVAVSANIDFAKSESSSVTYGKNQVLSQQTHSSSSNGGEGPYGVPGALSNQPPGVAIAPLTAPVVSTLSPAGLIALAPTLKSLAPTQSSNDTTTNYDVDKTIVHTVSPVGSVKRVSVAVLIDEKPLPGGDGKQFSVLAPAQIQQIQQLVEEAIGYDAKRGDSVKVVQMPFAGSQMNAALPWWQQSWFLSLAHGALRYLAILLLAFLLFLGLIKPVLRLLRERQERAQAVALASARGEQAPGQQGVSPGTQSGPVWAGAEGEVELPADPLKADLYVARQLVMQDPARAAQVVKEWLNGEQRS